MQISNVLAGHSGLTMPGKRDESVDPAGVQGPQVVEPQAALLTGAATAMGSILVKYDVTDISPLEFSEMLNKLYEAGTLSEQELHQLASIRLDLELDGVEPDESIDLLEFYVEKIEDTQRRFDDFQDEAAGRRPLAPLLDRLDWLEKFALIQSNPGSVGLNALA